MNLILNLRIALARIGSAAQPKKRHDGKIKHDNDDGEIDDEAKRVFRDGVDDRFILALAL
jgi:hypothetical protein